MTALRAVSAILGGCGKRFELLLPVIEGSACEGFHFHCLQAGGGIVAPHCAGGS